MVIGIFGKAYVVKRIILVKHIWESAFILHTKCVKFHRQMVKHTFYLTEIVGKACIRVRVSFGLVKCIFLVKSAFFNGAHQEEDRDGDGHCLIPEVPGTYPVRIRQLNCLLLHFAQQPRSFQDHHTLPKRNMTLKSGVMYFSVLFNNYQLLSRP